MTSGDKDPEVRMRGTARFAEVCILIGIVLFGVFLTVWRWGQVDGRMRSSLQEKATLISWALRVDHIAELSGTPSDLGTPIYERTKNQLMETRRLYPHIRFLYIMRKVGDGPASFVVDSEPPESPDYSPPGQPYEEASEAFLGVFTTRQEMTEGPLHDRWGVWVSASVPLYHPYTDELVAVLGLDVDASTWRGALIRGIVPPVVATMVLFLLAVLFLWLRRRHDRRLVSWRWEVAVAAVFGGVLTVAFALAVHENETWKREMAFRRMATVQASSLQQLMFRLGDNYLEGIARLFDGSNFVDRREFAQYTEFLLNRPYAQAWMWIPEVETANREAFEEAVRSYGAPDYRLWELDAERRHAAVSDRPLHFPVCYVEPQDRLADWLGFDLASQPEFMDAIEEARTSRLLTATPAQSRPGLGPGRFTVAFRPVFNRTEENRMSGVAATVVDMDMLLYRALSRDTATALPMTYMELYELVAGENPRFLASSDRDAPVRQLAERLILCDEGLTPVCFSAPVFAFGRVYALLARPASGFAVAYPTREGVRALLMGLAVTILGSSLLSLLATRRARLEQQVEARTAELRRSEESYRGLFNAIQQSIYIQDAQGRFVDVNDGATNRYGYAREEFTGRTPGFLAAPGRNDMALVERCFREAWAGHPQHFEFWGRTKAGEDFPKDVWLCKGTYLGQDVVIAVASDISDRKRSEEENRRLQAQLLQSQKMESIGRLAGGVAHDFNNMLQAIIGNANLAKMETPPGSALADYLTEIELSAQRSARLTRQLLAFASKQTVQPRILDLNDTVAGMLKMLQRLIGENIQLNWRPGPNLWPVKIDPGQIDQILANLAVNARDAIRDTGHIEIATGNYTCDPDDCHRTCTRCRPCRYVVIQVRDDGCGMTDEVRQHLFEPFFTTKEPGKGTGLGLATVFGIVHQNDGVIEVESAPGAGSTFRIMLPMIDTTHVPQPLPVEAQDTLSGRETVLLVEDEAVILNMGMVSLQRLGYTVLVAATPIAAMRIARDYPDAINLLITDVILPDLDGMELARRVRELRPEIRCLFMSGYTADVISDRGVLDESVHFIQKPFTITALAAKIREVIEARG